MLVWNGIQACDVLCAVTGFPYGGITRWGLSGDLRCYTNHNEPVAENENGTELICVYIHRPNTTLEPIAMRLAYLDCHAKYFIVRPTWVVENGHDGTFLEVWRKECSEIWRSLEGEDYPEGNIIAFLFRTLGKFAPFLRRFSKRFVSYVKFHCTAGVFKGFMENLVFPWVPDTIARYSLYRLSPKSMEHSIRAGEWQFVYGNRELFNQVMNEAR